MKRIGWLFICLLQVWSGAAQIPERVLPDGVGVNIHFVTGHEKDLDLIAAAGFKFIRMDFGWESIERNKGEYNWGEYDQLMDNLEKRGLRPVFIFDYSNPLYEEAVTSQNPITHQTHRTLASPQHPQSVAAFARWAAASAKHYQGRHVIWEIWNEPNISFWNPHPDAEQYTALALATSKAVRQAVPDATIIGPASSTFPWPFLEKFLSSGVLEYLDAVSVHPYRSPQKPPETAASDFARLQTLIERYAPESKRNKIPIFSGEWGYSSHTKGISLENQAAFAARQQLSNLFNGVPLSIWYDWKNDGPDPNENENNFGTVLPDLTPKPAYVAIQTLTHELSGYRILRRVALESERDYVLVCQGDGNHQKLVAWTLSEPHSVSLVLNQSASTSLPGHKGNGEGFNASIQGSALVLELSAAPQYVSLEGVGLKESTTR